MYKIAGDSPPGAERVAPVQRSMRRVESSPGLDLGNRFACHFYFNSLIINLLNFVLYSIYSFYILRLKVTALLEDWIVQLQSVIKKKYSHNFQYGNF